VRIIRALWTPGADVRFEGRHYRLEGAKPGPFPVHNMSIWLGAYQPRLFRLIGRGRRLGAELAPLSPGAVPGGQRDR
jgi:alkanesulfonate monooxygenase SsuD/methylene tetrahydromethanopterin reductase-like flavin-dependent oxidoreductase (luciferase family)